MKLKFYSLLIPALLWCGLESYGQGCVAIRQFSGVGNAIGQGNLLEKGEWNFNTNYRYFKSFRHFRGTHQERERVANNTEVINWSHGLDFNISYAFSSRVYGIVSLPLAYNERSSLYEHGRTERHMTYSGGLADMRIGAGYWILGEEKSKSGNMAFGAGIKLPTGDYNALGTFYNVGPNGEPQTRPVDQSIQLGDGGVGLILDMQGYWFIPGNLVWYYDGFYMFNPRNTNGTQTFRARQSEGIMSVPDQYAFRTGLLKTIPKIHGLGFSLGGRIEGIPVRDFIGESDGFRRPGYIISVEPGASYMIGNFTTTLNVPIALIRNRTRSLTDIADSTPDNIRHGDAAFADYLVNLGFAYRLAKKQPTPFKLN
ncbi:transporter [Litoribacter ruber]|uniref:transporter n=1 Tax=Litoribacter ruber TaxID=702568 RepID=UPI001BDB4BC2|nr:transporter [Litoribacter ruber]MBT0810943.1 transporter [Litoribacter ruber]